MAELKHTPSAEEQFEAALRKAYEDWQREAERTADQKKKFVTVSSAPLKPLYTPQDVKGIDYLRDIGFPGRFPYTRGVHASMYRGKPWTMRQFSGMGTPEETNRRYHYLLSQGQHGLSVAFDLPTDGL